MQISKMIIIDVNKERLELALEAAGLDLWENDLVTGEVTRKAVKIFAELGYSEDETAPFVEDIFAIIHPDDVSLVKNAINNHLTGTTAQYRCEFRVRAKNGAWVWFANYGRIVDRNSENAGHRFIGVTFNIDDRKRKEEELGVREQESRTLIENSPDTIARYDLNCRRIYVNPAFGAMADRGAAALLGKTPTEYPGGSNSLIYEAKIKEVIATGQGTQFELCWTGKVGKEICSHIRLTPERDLSGSIISVLGVGRDISKLKNSEEALRQSEDRFRSIIELAPIGMATTALDGRILLVNQAFCDMLGYEKEELLKLTFQEITHPEDKTLTNPQRQKLLDSEIETYQQEKRYLRKDGMVVWGLVSSTLERNNIEGLPYFIAQVEDITERKKTDLLLLQHKAAIETTHDGFWITNEQGILLESNQAYAKMSGYAIEELKGMHIRQLEAKEKSMEEVKAHVAKIISQGWDVFETRHSHKDGHEFDLEVSTSYISNSKQIVSFLRDISERKQHEEELRFIANFDALTGIPNRVLLADRMKQGIAQTSREQNMMAVCYLDLDGFKPINDEFGHATGDQVLITIAKRIGDCIRGGDTVARLGGDEFVVLLLGQEKGEECISILERLLADISAPITIKNQSVQLSASIGISIYPLDDEDPDTLLRHADQAMYKAKQSGKNRFYIYDLELDKRARDQSDYQNHIRYGLGNKQFELHYQPKINLRTGKFVGVEALIRWRHPERGLQSPADFLREIDNTDIDIKIGEWVTTTALAQMRQWREKGLDIEVSINISGFHMESAGFVEKLVQQLALYPDTPQGRLQIEVLETVALNDIAVVRGIIESCGKIGVGFALDDFGTGYSSLSYLSRLPVNTLKIDQSFIRDMLDDKGDRAIVQGIIALAQAFERHTIAEGVETELHYHALLDMGCEIGQGYYIAKPMLPEEIINWRDGRDLISDDLKGGI